jgi:hypothetical protein
VLPSVIKKDSSMVVYETKILIVRIIRIYDKIMLVYLPLAISKVVFPGPVKRVVKTVKDSLYGVFYPIIPIVCIVYNIVSLHYRFSNV